MDSIRMRGDYNEDFLSEFLQFVNEGLQVEADDVPCASCSEDNVSVTTDTDILCSSMSSEFSPLDETVGERVTIVTDSVNIDTGIGLETLCANLTASLPTGEEHVVPMVTDEVAMETNIGTVGLESLCANLAPNISDLSQLEVDCVDSSVLQDIDLYLECNDDGNISVAPEPTEVLTSLISSNVQLRISFPVPSSNPATEYPCLMCAGKFTEEKDLKLHIKENHGGIFSCDRCAYNTSSRTYFVKHRQKHLQGKKKRGPNIIDTKSNRNGSRTFVPPSDATNLSSKNLSTCVNVRKNLIHKSEIYNTSTGKIKVSEVSHAGNTDKTIFDKNRSMVETDLCKIIDTLQGSNDSKQCNVRVESIQYNSSSEVTDFVKTVGESSDCTQCGHCASVSLSGEDGTQQHNRVDSPVMKSTQECKEHHKQTDGLGCSVSKTTASCTQKSKSVDPLNESISVHFKHQNKTNLHDCCTSSTNIQYDTRHKNSKSPTDTYNTHASRQSDISDSHKFPVSGSDINKSSDHCDGSVQEYKNDTGQTSTNMFADNTENSTVHQHSATESSGDTTDQGDTTGKKTPDSGNPITSLKDSRARIPFFTTVSCVTTRQNH